MSSPRVWRFWRESFKATVASPIPSLGALIITAAMCLGIILTDGRTVGAQREALRRIDDAGTTSIIVRADPQAGIPPSILQHFQNIEGVDFALALGPAVDVRNSQVPGGTRVPLRKAWTLNQSRMGLATRPAPLGTRPALASTEAARALGLMHGYGGVRGENGESTSVVGTFAPARELFFLEPLLVIPMNDSATEGSDASVTTLVIRTASPAVLNAVERAVKSNLQVFDPSLVQIRTSGETAALRGQVGDSLARSSKSLVTAILVLSAVLLGLVWSAVIMLRRREFGRRRALGASQRLVVLLVLLQVSLLGICGAAVGVASATLSLLFTADPLPNPKYLAAVAVLALTVSIASAVVPAAAAARRDPLKELRVP